MSSSQQSTPASQPVGLEAIARVLGMVMIAMLGGVLLMAAVVVFAVVDGPGELWGALITLVVGCVLAFGALVAPPRQLQPWPASSARDPQRASGQLRSAAFMAMVLGEVPALVGVINGVVVDGWLPVLVGAAISAVAIPAAGPTKARLTEWNARLEADGARTGL